MIKLAVAKECKALNLSQNQEAIQAFPVDAALHYAMQNSIPDAAPQPIYYAKLHTMPPKMHLNTQLLNSLPNYLRCSMAVNSSRDKIHRREADVSEVGLIIDNDVTAVDIQVASDALEVGLEEEARGVEGTGDIKRSVDEEVLDSDGADIEVYSDVSVGARLVVGELDGGGLDVAGGGGGGDGGGQEGEGDGCERLHVDGWDFVCWV